MRLGFAVAINVDPDVLLVDEVLAVGDEAFTHKCLDKFAELRRRGRTVVLVTHSLELVTRFCDAALWLDGGMVRTHGDPRRVIDAYLMDVARGEDAAMKESDASPLPAKPDEPPDMFKADEGRWGTREAEIVGVELRRADGTDAHVFRSGEGMEIRLRVRAHEPLSDVAFGVGIFNVEGVCCFGTNTEIDEALLQELRGEGEVAFTVDRLDLVEGTYKLDVAVHRRNGAPYDYHRLQYTFRVTSATKDTGIYRPPHRWRFSGGIRVR
jgi:hypothetical protein